MTTNYYFIKINLLIYKINFLNCLYSLHYNFDSYDHIFPVVEIAPKTIQLFLSVYTTTSKNLRRNVAIVCNLSHEAEAKFHR